MEEYHFKTKSLLKAANISNSQVYLKLAPLVNYKDSTGEYSYYDCSKDLSEFSEFVKTDNFSLQVLVLVDGPPSSTCKNARYPALAHIITYFQHAKIDILIDDYNRLEEKEIIKLWKAHLDNMQISNRQIDLKFEKGACFLQINFDM